MRFTHILIAIALTCSCSLYAQHPIFPKETPQDLTFKNIATSWDEGLPLGNAILGALLWEKNNRLRMSLDRIDLWDLHSADFIKSNNFNFKWIYEQLQKNNYGVVQEQFDTPYNSLAMPTKIPGAALEFNTKDFGKVKKSHLYIKDAIAEIKWENGIRMQSYVHATKPIGYFIFTGVEETFSPELFPPSYNITSGQSDNSHAGGDLVRLGYTQGDVIKTPKKITYHQVGSDGFFYDVAVEWRREGKTLYGIWSITSSLVPEKAAELTKDALTQSDKTLHKSHTQWWCNFWNKSSISLPDPVLQKQYENEIYKLGSVARAHSYPISLQAIWTADNGLLPPWKGDYHHDLNTQLSYWPCYTGNYLDESMGYINTLWKQIPIHKEYTKNFYGTNGLNVPGVCNLLGEPMGGWVQYACSPTVSSWLGQHFYLQWKYSADKDFLKEKAYPYIKDAATHLEEFSVIKEGIRTLPLSSSPEIHDNSINAWFPTMTNYDLGLVKFTFTAAAEMAKELNLTKEAAHWEKLGKEFPNYDLDEHQGLTFAKNTPYNGSHRHFSHAMAIHPLGLIDKSQGRHSQNIINATIAALDKHGPGGWVGYSYSWLGNMKARNGDGEGAAKALSDFANCFCLRNTFHVNGDQSRSGKSGFTYRPFTLEGNFAFAAGIQEMLLQSHTGIIQLFPAIPAAWQRVSFDKLRTYGAFIISATRTQGLVDTVKITAEKGGMLKLTNPFGDKKYTAKGAQFTEKDGILSTKTSAGQIITLTINK